MYKAALIVVNWTEIFGSNLVLDIRLLTLTHAWSPSLSWIFLCSLFTYELISQIPVISHQIPLIYDSQNYSWADLPIVRPNVDCSEIDADGGMVGWKVLSSDSGPACPRVCCACNAARPIKSFLPNSDHVIWVYVLKIKRHLLYPVLCSTSNLSNAPNGLITVQTPM